MSLLARAFRQLARGVAWAGAAVLIGVFLIGYAAPYLPPRWFWWTNLVAVGLVPLGGAVALVAAGLLWTGVRAGRWLRVLVAVALGGLLVERFAPRVPTDRAAGGPAADTLRVMSFNVPQSRPAEAVGGVLDRASPAVAAVQESQIRTGTDAPPSVVRTSSSLRTTVPPKGAYAFPRVLPPGATIQQPVLGRLPLDSLTVHPLPPDGETSPRSRYTRTHFVWQGRPAVLLNVHLHTVGTMRPWMFSGGWTNLSQWVAFLRTYRAGALYRARQARRIRRVIERTERPLLVVGDFNSTRHQWAYRHIASGLQNAVTTAGTGWDATFPASFPLVRIDHVLAGPAWRVTAAHVPSLPDAAASDHRPVVAHLRWR